MGCVEAVTLRTPATLARPSRTWLGAYVGVTLSWGFSFLFIKLALNSFTPFGVIFPSCAIGAVIMLLIGKVKRVGLPRERMVWFHLGIVALSVSALPGFLSAMAESHTSSLFAGIVLSGMTPLTSLFFITIVFRDEPMSRPQVLGLGIGVVGVLTVFGIWHGLGNNPWWAIAALVSASTLVGFSSTLSSVPHSSRPQPHFARRWPTDPCRIRRATFFHRRWTQRRRSNCARPLRHRRYGRVRKWRGIYVELPNHCRHGQFGR